MLPEHLCDLIGKIYYAATFADKVIKIEEIEAMTKYIEEDWHEKRISDSFYECLNLSYDPTKVIDDVVFHRIQYPELFTAELNRKIVDTTYRIVNASSGTNKSEIVFISQLTNALKAT